MPALVVIDMLTSYDFEDADELARHAEKVVPNVADLIDRAREDDDLQLLYVNDNYGHWNSSRDELVDIALDGRHPELVEPLKPDHEDLFIVKARHSIFYGTPLEYLLSQLGVDRLVLTGVVTEQCILYSALDAYVRRIPVAVVRDGVAPIDERLGDAALEMMERNMRAEVCEAREVLG
jgi:nicotinamidase-related amidase